jgi:hypothetical protein
MASAGRAETLMIGDLRRGESRLRANWGRPWEKHERVNDLELGGAVVVAIQGAGPV